MSPLDLIQHPSPLRPEQKGWHCRARLDIGNEISEKGFNNQLFTKLWQKKLEWLESVEWVRTWHDG